MATIDEQKDVIRQGTWRRLSVHKQAFPPTYKHIPDFKGGDLAAWLLAETPEWQRARVIKATPDRPQAPERLMAWNHGLLAYVAVPKLALAEPYYEINPDTLDVSVSQLFSMSGVAKVAPTISLEQMKPIDLAILGSVAVDRLGRRIGKGAGYGDLEIALLTRRGSSTTRRSSRRPSTTCSSSTRFHRTSSTFPSTSSSRPPR